MKKCFFALMLSFFAISCQKADTSLANKDELLREKFFNYLGSNNINESMLVSITRYNIWKEINWDKEPEKHFYEDKKLSGLIFYLQGDERSFNYRSLILYYSSSELLPVLITSEKLMNGTNKVSYSKLNGDLYYNFTMDENYRIVNTIRLESISFPKTFKNEFQNLKTRDNVISEKTEGGRGSSCLESTNTWRECVTCILNEFSSDPFAGLVCMVYGPACAALIALSCGVAQL